MLNCKQCGYETENLEAEDCPICNEKLTKNNILTLEEVVDQCIICDMRQAIDKTGNDKYYECIERIKEPIRRAKYRKYFLLAGGLISEKSIF